MDAETRARLHELLEAKARQYNTPAFIEADPIAIPHRFSQKEDIEIAGFLAATLAWGQRPTILKSTTRLLALMDDAPYAFVMEASPRELARLQGFVHRTFNGVDAVYFVQALRHLYQHHGGLEGVFTQPVQASDPDLSAGLCNLRRRFFELPDAPARTRKHVPDITRGSAAKRINMYLRWMVRQDSMGVDFGLWRGLHPRQLLIPLDVHSGHAARHLGLLQRTQSDWRAVQALTETLRCFDADDPVRYDFALFGLAANELKQTRP